MTRETKVKIAEFLKVMNKEEWARSLMADHERTENALQHKDVEISRNNDLVKYLQGRDRKLIKLEEAGKNERQLTDGEQDRYVNEVQEFLKQTGNATLVQP